MVGCGGGECLPVVPTEMEDCQAAACLSWHPGVERVESEEPPALPKTRIEYRCKCPTASHFILSGPEKRRGWFPETRPEVMRYVRITLSTWFKLLGTSDCWDLLHSGVSFQPLKHNKLKILSNLWLWHYP